MHMWGFVGLQTNRPIDKLLILLVGAEGFEPPTLCSQSRCATRLRYAPTLFDCSADSSPFRLEQTSPMAEESG